MSIKVPGGSILLMSIDLPGGPILCMSIYQVG